MAEISNYDPKAIMDNVFWYFPDETLLNVKIRCMDMVIVPASITIEEGISNQKYRWKHINKISTYRKKTRRAVVRITSANFVNRLSKKGKDHKQVKINFYKKDKQWFIELERTEESGSTLQTYFGSHPYLQLVLNKHLPNKIWKEYEMSGKKTYTRPVYVCFDLEQWSDLNLAPHDFLIQVEKEAKSLMNESLKHGFTVDYISKGRAYDLELISPKGNKFILAISMHTAKNESRSKEKRKQKILMDISKMLPLVYGKRVFPIIVSQPLSFEGSWSFTTGNYLDFYKTKFDFKFLTTDFKKGWENKVIKRLLEIDNEL